MFSIVHQMRTRIITSPSFTGERIIAAILFLIFVVNENQADNSVLIWGARRVEM